MDTKSWTRSPKSGKDGHEVLDAKSEKRKDGHEVPDAKSEKRQRWTRSPGREVRKAVKMDAKSVDTKSEKH
ncbi:hypothetical protein CDL15_Pgr005994 [Punica granatum]|uniref:Uncharacterized protein n=1 Tax=Punica granatum TaxID=22663 RepID=A0A218VV06_PUNGR|nr:hypothetical protein CDL15_Pgr005994 [Punica granatum]